MQLGGSFCYLLLCFDPLWLLLFSCTSSLPSTDSKSHASAAAVAADASGNLAFMSMTPDTCLVKCAVNAGVFSSGAAIVFITVAKIL